MRKFKGALISLALLLLITGGWLIIKNIDFPTREEAPSDTETTQFGDVFTLQAEDIEYIEISNAKDNYAFTLDEGVWHEASRHDIQLLQDAVSKAVFTASYFDAYTIDEGKFDPSDYGLDVPTMKIKLRMKDKTEHRLVFGSKAPTDDYLYYLSIDDRPAVYAILGSKYDMLAVSLDAYRPTEFFTFDYNDIKKISIAGRDKQKIIIEENSSGSATSGSSWIMTAPYCKNVDDFTLAQLIIDPLTEKTVEIMSYADDRPTDLSSYGLDNPSCEITFSYAEKDVTIKLGDNASEGGIYAMISGSQTVYIVDYNYFSFAEYTAFEYVNKTVYNTPLTSLSSFEIDNGDKKYIIEIKDGSSFLLNGKKLSAKSAKSLYEQMSLLSINGAVKEAPYGRAATVFRYNFSDGHSESVEFIPYRSRYYGVSINGEKADFYVKKSDVTELIGIIAGL